MSFYNYYKEFKIMSVFKDTWHLFSLWKIEKDIKPRDISWVVKKGNSEKIKIFLTTLLNMCKIYIFIKE